MQYHLVQLWHLHRRQPSPQCGLRWLSYGATPALWWGAAFAGPAPAEDCGPDRLGTHPAHSRNAARRLPQVIGSTISGFTGPAAIRVNEGDAVLRNVAVNDIQMVKTAAAARAPKRGLLL